MCFVRLLKHWYKEQTMQIKWGKHFSEPFHASNGVRQGGVLSPYLFVVYLDDLSNELNNIKAGSYIGEVLLNHLIFADDICVLCPSVRWLQRILDVCQAYAESHGIIFNCNKTVCMSFKAKSARSTATPVLKLGGQYVNTVDQYKYLGILLDTELSDDKDIKRLSFLQIVKKLFQQIWNMKTSTFGCLRLEDIYDWLPNSGIFLTLEMFSFLRGNRFFSSVDNDFVEMLQRMPLTYFDE